MNSWPYSWMRENERDVGFPLQAYAFSKAAVNRLTELYARKLPQVVTACSPGFCRTPMTEASTKRPPYSSAEGAEIVVAAAKGPSGRYITRDHPEGSALVHIANLCEKSIFIC